MLLISLVNIWNQSFLLVLKNNFRFSIVLELSRLGVRVLRDNNSHGGETILVLELPSWSYCFHRGRGPRETIKVQDDRPDYVRLVALVRAG